MTHNEKTRWLNDDIVIVYQEYKYNVPDAGFDGFQKALSMFHRLVGGGIRIPTWPARLQSSWAFRTY